MSSVSSRIGSSPRQHRYQTQLNDGTIEAVRPDETLTLGEIDQLITILGSDSFRGPMGCSVDIRLLLSEITLPRVFGDEVRGIPPGATGPNGHPERLRELAAVMMITLNHGFERRSGRNPL
jgi:hypothetical protein